MKRILSLVLALSMVLSMFSFAFAGTTLPDVAGTDYEAAVSALVELGIVNGYEDGTYRADKTVTRAEMAKFLVVSAGLEGAADVAKGATNFSDVPATHWATGYINVASQYGYINGYPEGTFAPDATVSYAEAVTMAIRVLGYKTVVEAKGTWPTNYIAKATELKVLEDVSYGRYTDGATRGNVALLMWNMLTTDMWDVISENENNGLSYGKGEVGVKMINKYFADYVYVGEEYEATVANIVVDDGKVTIDLVPEKTLPIPRTTVELANGIDFLNLTGRTVSVLYNKKAEKIVMVTPSNSDRVVEGYLNELSGDKAIFSGDPATTWGTVSGDVDDYVVAVLGKGKNVETTTRYSLATSTIVEEVKTKKDVVKVNKSFDLDEDVIVLIDGEWATAADIEVDDVLTQLDTDLYIVSRDIVKGEFEAVTDEKDTEETRYFVTVDGEEYSAVADLTVEELDEDDEVVGTARLADIIEAEEDERYGKYYGENVTLYLNFLGEIERITFGEVEENENVGAFYVLTNAPKASWEVSDKNGEVRYIELNGESYEIKSTVASGDIPTNNVSGDIVYVTFDSKDRVTAIYEVATDRTLGADYADEAVSGDYEIKAYASADEILDDYNYISGDHKVTSSTIVVKITPVVTEEDDVETVEYYEVETFKGASELEGVKNAVVAISREDNAFENASYVFVWEDAKNTEKTHGIVEKYTKSNGIVYLTIEGTKYELETVTDAWSGDNSATPDMYVGRAVEFIDNEDGINITKSYGADELAAAPEVVEVEDGKIFKFSGDVLGKVDLTKYEEDLEDARIFVVYVSETEDAYEFDSFEEVELADVKVKKGDRIAADATISTLADLVNAETILVIRGYED